MTYPICSTLDSDLPLTPPRAILFDMDGTLTRPRLDFDAIRRAMGVEGPILEALEKLTGDRRTAAERILHRYEEEAAAQSALNPGCRELLEQVRTLRLPSALVTRNTRKSVTTVFERHDLHFDVCVTREDGKFKPDPAPLLLACERLSVRPADAWMVGDGYHDIEAANAAGMTSIWLSHGNARQFTAEPTVVVLDLPELSRLLSSTLR